MRSIKQQNDDAAGFTLVELSIVLVIIGLIVGGVVGGRSLIASANQQKTIRELSEWTTAYRAFDLQYDVKPGDMVDAWDYFGKGVTSPNSTSICGGADGSTTNEHSLCNGNGDNIYNSQVEAIRAWSHMQHAGVLQGKVTPYAPAMYLFPEMSDTRVNVPRAEGAVGGAGWNFYDARGGPNATASGKLFGKIGTWLVLGTPYFYSMWNGALTPKQAYAIDKKMDDGLPIFGKVAAARNNAACVPSSIGYHSAVVDKTIRYNLADSEVSCHMFFYIGN